MFLIKNYLLIVFSYYRLVEHMAHLVSRDYDEIPIDLLLLGFIPESKTDAIDDSGIVEVLVSIYGNWTDGGGANAGVSLYL